MYNDDGIWKSADSWYMSWPTLWYAWNKTGNQRKLKRLRLVLINKKTTELSENTVTPRNLVLFEKQTNAEFFKNTISFYAAPIFISYSKTARCCPYHKNGKVSYFSSTLIISKYSDSLGISTKIMQVSCLHNQCLVFSLTSSTELIIFVEE
jgi:hypothetical protein